MIKIENVGKSMDDKIINNKGVLALYRNMLSNVCLSMCPYKLRTYATIFFLIDIIVYMFQLAKYNIKSIHVNGMKPTFKKIFLYIPF